jgi:hypothetical protein
MLELEFAVFEVGEDGGEEKRARLLAAFAGLDHRGPEPIRHPVHAQTGRKRRFLRRAAFILRFLRSLGFS